MEDGGSIDLEVCQSVIGTFAGARALVFYETLRCFVLLIRMDVARVNCGAQLVLPGGNGARRWRRNSLLINS
jgi:hypothetical protein